jgi:AbiV family abortive infection protein
MRRIFRRAVKKRKETKVRKMAPSRKIGVLEETSHIPILNNAVRLLEDARLLRKARRYPSSAALAILSLEELGKFRAHNRDMANWNSRMRRSVGAHRYNHKQKQKIAAQAIVEAMGCDEVSDLLEVQGYEIKIAPLARTPSDGPSEIDIIASIDDRTFQARIANKIRRSAHHRFVIDLAAGRFDKIKQESFYVDEAHDGTLREPTTRIDRLVADRIIRLASGAIHSTKMVLRYAKALGAVSNRKPRS